MRAPPWLAECADLAGRAAGAADGVDVQCKMRPSNPCAPLACANRSNARPRIATAAADCGTTDVAPRIAAADLMPIFLGPTDGTSTRAEADFCAGPLSPARCEPPPPRPSPDGFSRVGLVLLVSRAERVQWLLPYAAWFASMQLLVLDPARPDGCARCEAAVRSAARRARGALRGALASRVRCVCVDGVDANRSDAFVKRAPRPRLARNGSARIGVANLHAAFAPLMLRAVEEAPDLRGAAYMHMDFALNPANFGAAPPLDDLWTPRSGVLPRYRDPCCFRVPWGAHDARAHSFPAGWGWYGDSKRRCARAAAASGARSCCFGWSDFVYVPSWLLPAWVSLLTGAYREVFHEVAVPSVAALLVQRRAASWRLLPRCSGSATADVSRFAAISSMAHEATQRVSVPFLEALERGHCAHKLDLSWGTHRRALGALLQRRLPGGE